MIRLFLIEWYKLRKYRAFQVLTGLYFLLVVVVCSSGMLFLQYLKSKGVDFKSIDPTMLPVYHFPFVWQNLAYVASRLKLILAFLVILSITNEITYKTLRQNIIDGMTRFEFMVSKLSMIFVLSLINTLLIFLIGLITGLIYSHDRSLTVIFTDMQYLWAFFLNIFSFLVFALLIALLIQRTGVVIIFLAMYTVIIEPIITAIFSNAPLPPIFARLAPFFPRQAITNLIPNPFPQYILREIQDYVSFSSVAIAGGEMLLFLGMIYLMLKWKKTS